MTKTDKPQPKRVKPETMREAQTWETVKTKYLDYGLCHTCAPQAAWGHQIGFSQTTRQPCAACAPLVAALPKPQPNGWRSVEGRASRPESWKAVLTNGPRARVATPGGMGAARRVRPVVDSESGTGPREAA